MWHLIKSIVANGDFVPSLSGSTPKAWPSVLYHIHSTYVNIQKKHCVKNLPSVGSIANSTDAVLGSLYWVSTACFVLTLLLGYWIKMTHVLGGFLPTGTPHRVSFNPVFHLVCIHLLFRKSRGLRFPVQTCKSNIRLGLYRNGSLNRTTSL